MSNHKVYLNNGDSININCDNFTFNTDTNSYDFILNNKVAFSIKPKYITIDKIVKESPLATGIVVKH